MSLLVCGVHTAQIMVLEVQVHLGCYRLSITQVFTVHTLGPIGALAGARQVFKRHLPNRHLVVELDGELARVVELEGHLQAIAWVEVASGGVDNEPQATERTLPLESPYEFIRHTSGLVDQSQSELLRVEDERLVGFNSDGAHESLGW